MRVDIQIENLCHFPHSYLATPPVNLTTVHHGLVLDTPGARAVGVDVNYDKPLQNSSHRNRVK